MPSMTTTAPIIISVDGNVGAGKSYFLEAIKESFPDVEVVLEPVGEWMRLKNAEGKSLLELFYEDKRRWAYTFQNCAILTRLKLIREAAASTKKRIILTERSVLTDRYVFAEMLREAGDIDALEWDLYMNWFNSFAGELPISGIIYLNTSVETAATRIVKRGRHGEDHIPLDYLSALDRQHQKWLASVDKPVLRLSTESGSSLSDNIARLRAFINELVLGCELYPS
jgi:deoxyadenosine/deoxycytidine kinase